MSSNDDIINIKGSILRIKTSQRLITLAMLFTEKAIKTTFVMTSYMLKI